MTDLAFLTFDELLAHYFDRPGVEAELARRYATTAGVLVIDLTGMTARTDARGIGYALALAAAAQRAMAPALAGHGGVQVKQVADTVFHVFDDPRHALLAALDAQRALAAFAVTRRLATHVPDADVVTLHEHAAPHELVRACIGLGWGDALFIPGRDVFGPEVNRAFVLGEDVARGGEVLATDAFLAAAGELPVGVGAFRAPSDRVEEVGFPFHVLADYR